MKKLKSRRFRSGYQSQQFIAGKFDFFVADDRTGQIIARCWSNRMANLIAKLLERERSKKGKQ